MKVESVEILCDLSYENIFDINVDVAVKLEDWHTYIVVVATQKKFLTLMGNEICDFLSPGDPMIVVRKLTKEVVEKAIEAYAEDDAYYLKLYAAALDVKILDILKDGTVATYEFMGDLLEKGESIDDIDDLNINND